VVPQTPAVVINHSNNNNYQEKNNNDSQYRDQWFKDEEIMRKKLEKNAIS
jgi:hypothetical protein